MKRLWRGSGTGYTPTLGVAYGGLWGENYSKLFFEIEGNEAWGSTTSTSVHHHED